MNCEEKIGMTKKKTSILAFIVVCLLTLSLSCLISNDKDAVWAADRTTKSSKSEYLPSEYPYDNSKSSKLTKLYQEAMEYKGSVEKAALENKDKWSFLEQKEEKHFFLPDITYFKQTNYASSYLYYGNVKDGRPDGKGIVFVWDYYDDYDGYIVKYMGEFEEGVLDGYGIEIDDPEDVETYIYETYTFDYSVLYEGEWKNGLYDGDGIFYAPKVSTDEYEEYEHEDSDDYVEDVYVEQICVGTDGILYDGKWSKGERAGKGKYYYPLTQGGKLWYAGKWKNDEWNGKGKEYYPDGMLCYDGELKNGKYHGKGKLYYENGQLKYNGKFKNGKYHGKGKLYNEDGSLNHKGKFENGDIK